MVIHKLRRLASSCSLALIVLAGCSGSTDAPSDLSSEPAAEGVIDLEVWGSNDGYRPIEKGSKLYELYKKTLGVGIISPYVEWNGGTTYQNRLNLKIAAGEMPDLFLPWQGIESNLAKNGAIADLTELLPAYAPNVWRGIPKDVWDVVKANDPTGQGRIYYIPIVMDYGRYAAMIRKDWLEALGLSMPTTQEAYVQVLEAFRDQDPNGNGQQDEIPTGGRQEARWMDHLFAMYGVAMIEGYPDWDLYDGKLTYSAVTPNMKAALAFLSKLHKEGLLDTESLLNDKLQWDGKVQGDKAGSYYHWLEQTHLYLDNMYKNTGVKGNFSVMPVLEVSGYQGFYSKKKVGNPQWVVKNNKDRARLMATLKLLNNLYDKRNWNALYLGVEGMHYTLKDGKAIRLPDDKRTQENLLLHPWQELAALDFTTRLLKGAASDDSLWSVDQTIRNMEGAQAYSKNIAGDGLPASIYAGFPDINNRTLYVEYATKMILGQYPISKFDEFVEKWYASGGDEVTKRARAWYEKVNEPVK
ncbi:extracellular solute-binding protein [Paenibacillus mucilaginosus]|uniref:Extracellular solute-binding protein family 1 n=1 Tax=Paenibacillus mucilaginosus (strain KNP414) TaxID=1036673 RepID=F8F6F5_PAEMK|nr:extracellular solute-binding protein [Paenibacillus mucilaginosus]AEI42909.1 extracellular solute-binding protein family 1 [Paenibacillus mucilaginosus KNP414]MCG7216026.1 extracellular solute-binding protein [Paenibacillus mucilaginosus]WDM31070.1 extracellular solute-binding protein [Paenibacillus mucilaginosus]